MRHARSIRYAGAVAAVALAAPLLISAPAEALSPYGPLLSVKSVTTDAASSATKAKCTLTIKKVNANGTVNIQVAGQAQPTTLAGYTNNIKTVLDCIVRPYGGTVLHREGNHSIARWTG